VLEHYHPHPSPPPARGRELKMPFFNTLSKGRVSVKNTFAILSTRGQQAVFYNEIIF